MPTVRTSRLAVLYLASDEQKKDGGNMTCVIRFGILLYFLSTRNNTAVTRSCKDGAWRSDSRIALLQYRTHRGNAVK